MPDAAGWNWKQITDDLQRLLRLKTTPIGMKRYATEADMMAVPFRFGGTSVLIVVGVALDTIAQMNQHLLLRKYDGFMKKGRVRFRGRIQSGNIES